MIAADTRSGDYYLLEALRSDVRKCEADYDTVLMIEEHRRTKVRLLLNQADLKLVEEARETEREEAVRFIEAKAHENTEKTMAKQGNYERKMKDMKEVRMYSSEMMAPQSRYRP